MYFERLARALPEVRARIARARERAGRSDADPVTLVAVTKGHPLEALQAARAAGLSVIGESRVQEAAEKREAGGDQGLSWHLVGHLQRNKVRDALPLFDLIHSVDSQRLARAIELEGAKRDARVAILVQVNVSGEESKYGFAAEEALPAMRKICGLDHLRVVGLMTMAPLTNDELIVRATFERARQLFERCAAEIEGFEAKHLSMGMTNDYEIAVAEGSNMLRLGTALFGERPND